MNKKRGGFSYIEILLALGLFVILLAAVLPTLLQAVRNMGFATTYYQTHLLAHAIMLDIRDDLLDGALPQTAAANASNHAANREIPRYLVWVYDASYNQYSHGNGPDAQLSLTSAGLSVVGGGYMIVVTIWDDEDNMTGRAIGAANPLWGDSYEGP